MSHNDPAMSNKLLLPAFLLIVLTGPASASSADSSASPISFWIIFRHLDSNLGGSFTLDDGAYHFAAIPATYLLIRSSADWKWNTYTNEQGISTHGFIAAEMGTLVPVAVSLSLYLYGRSQDDVRLQVTALALGQAALLSVGISSVYKVFSGRWPPDNVDVPRGRADYSGDFHFGFLRRGAFEGWPSSHTMDAFSMATTIAELYPGRTTLQLVSYTYASLIGIGVSTNIHWLSNAVAGALIGYAIGKTVGDDFWGIMAGDGPTSSISLFPIPGGIQNVVPLLVGELGGPCALLSITARGTASLSPTFDSREEKLRHPQKPQESVYYVKELPCRLEYSEPALWGRPLRPSSFSSVTK
ncbi:MAG TPA: phosphatase PAP2 family protein [Bacteroidota bacterium]|nr:phosphatase PAP2 family protein [Bacteroidota bacterium]